MLTVISENMNKLRRKEPNIHKKSIIYLAELKFSGIFNKISCHHLPCMSLYPHRYIANMKIL